MAKRLLRSGAADDPPKTPVSEGERLIARWEQAATPEERLCATVAMFKAGLFHFESRGEPIPGQVTRHRRCVPEAWQQLVPCVEAGTESNRGRILALLGTLHKAGWLYLIDTGEAVPESHRHTLAVMLRRYLVPDNPVGNSEIFVAQLTRQWTEQLEVADDDGQVPAAAHAALCEYGNP